MNHVHDPVTSTFPPEVTSSIFLACIDEAPSYPFTNSTLWRIANIPWTLGAVCRQWRQIVWATPELWTLIRILVTSLQPERLVYMRERLLRSGQIPLQLQITPTTYEDGLDIQTVFDFLHERNRTWDSLHIKLLDINSQDIQCDPQAFSKLRVLRLHNVSTISITQDIFWRESVKPEPEVVELRGFSPHGLNIDWKNVKDFVAESLPIPRFLEVLQKAPKLRRCYLSTKSRSHELEPSPAVASIYAHNKLQELSIEGFDDKKMSDLLDNACFPSLSHLSFDHMHYRLPTNVILSFIRRSSCLLKQLTLLDADLGNSIIPLLRELPSLRHLHLSPRYGYNFSPKELFKVLASSSIPDVINKYLKQNGVISS
ncbi:hypothetical protein CPB84DRAFT_658151 [Gymnopilus junonius]|uniref:F-box domain-containing protein n=1 Tax=Gymnopilus junonius TaxID=109634 RepID=A0A9P5N7Q0_GYMJU|nr:hypothetical protein CPB84DRAFT_658151 [Gymnopilus junonius]